MSGSFSSIVSRQPTPEPGGRRVLTRRDSIIFRRIALDQLISDPTSFTPIALRAPAKTALEPLAELLEVEMLVNPFKAGFQTPRDVNFQPTSAKGRYVSQDWGPGLTKIHLECQTGSIIPIRTPPKTATDRYRPVQSNGLPQVKTFDTQGYLQSPMAADVGWTALALASERFQNFLALYVVSNDYDGDTEILLMTFGRAIFRGVIENFQWEMEADRAWNIKYSFDFTVQAGMDTWTRGIKGDDDTDSFLRGVSAVDDVPFPPSAEAQLNNPPIIFGRSFYSVDGNGGLSLSDVTTFFSDPFTGLVPVSFG